MSLEELNDVEHVRARPAMYIATTGFIGLIHYFVSAVNLFLERTPKWIAVEALDNCFRIRSDAGLGIELNESHELLPFEKFRKPNRGLGLDGPILNALSSRLMVRTEYNGCILQLTYDCGRRIEESSTLGESTESVVEFTPDASIFSISHFSAYNFDSYLHRISFLNPSTSFSFSEGGRTRIFHSPDGLRSMFDQVASPYQILHEPIHFRHIEGDLDLEIVWGFHSWQSDVVWSFINKGRAVEGGTHDRGLAKALELLPEKIGIKSKSNGIVAIMSILYPGAVWEGCIKAKIGNKELEPMVQKTVEEQSLKWIDSHPGIREQIVEIQKFQFPDAWTSR